MARESKRFRFKQIEFWAKNGRIYMLDLEKCADSGAALDSQIKTKSPREVMEAAIAIRMSVARSGDKPDDRRESIKLLDDAKAVGLAAKAQGDPTDARVLEHVSRHKRKNSVSMADSRFLLPPVGGLAGVGYKLRLTDPRDMLLNGVNVVPDLTVPSGMHITKAMSESLARRLQR